MTNSLIFFKNIKWKLISALLVMIVLPYFVSAQSGGSSGGTGGGGSSGGTGAGGTSGGGTLSNPLQFESIAGLFNAILDIVIIIAIPIIVFFIIFAGFKYVTAQGDSEAVKKATSMFTWAVIGGVLILGAKVLVEIIQNTVNAL